MKAGPVRRAAGAVGLLALVPTSGMLVAGNITLQVAAVRAAVSGLAGRQDASTRPIAFFSLSSASRPRTPPTSISDTPCRSCRSRSCALSPSRCGLSEAGILTTRRVCFAALADSLIV